MYQRVDYYNGAESTDDPQKKVRGIDLSTSHEANCDPITALASEFDGDHSMPYSALFDAADQTHLTPDMHFDFDNNPITQKSTRQGGKRRRITHFSEAHPAENWNIWTNPNLNYFHQSYTNRSLSPLSRLLLDNTTIVGSQQSDAVQGVCDDQLASSKCNSYPYLYMENFENFQSFNTGDEGPTFAPPLLPTSDKLCHPSILGSEFMEETIILHAAQCSSSNSSCANDQEPNFQPIAWATPSISGLVSPAIAVHESTRLMSDASDSTTSSFEGKGVPFHPGIPESNVVVPTDCINTVAFPSVFTPRASSNLNYLQMQHHKQPGHLDPRYISRRSNGNERASEEHTPIRGGKRGPFKDPELRKQTAQTRKRGSCIRCRMQRIRCEANEGEPEGPCLTCKRVTGAKAGRFPCLRYKITDVMLYKQGQVPGYEWTQRWNNSISDPIRRWASSEIKTITICEGYSHKGVQFQVRQFVPEEGDKLERTWDYKGQKMAVRVPPYALVDMEEGRQVYERYISECLDDAFLSVLGSPDGMLSKTYQQAVNLSRSPETSSNTADLLNLTMRLWMSVRLSTKTTFIIGKEKLGMCNDILDRTNPTPGKIPIPPVFGAQLDVILIHHIQSKLRRQLLDKLQDTIFQNKQANWFITYLVKFILLHNTALIIEHDMNYAKKHGMQRRFAREHKVQEYHLGANILLAHFHYCNKGMYPFSDKCKDQELRNLAHLNEEQTHFVYKSRAFINRHKADWLRLRQHHEYENPWFYVSQLYEEDWRPSPMLI